SRRFPFVVALAAAALVAVVVFVAVTAPSPPVAQSPVTPPGAAVGDRSVSQVVSDAGLPGATPPPPTAPVELGSPGAPVLTVADTVSVAPIVHPRLIAVTGDSPRLDGLRVALVSDSMLNGFAG